MLEHPALTRPALSVPAYSGQLYIELNGDVPYFTANQYTTTSYEYYSARDSFGRCGIAVASIGKDLMPTSSRGSISSVTPSGWHSNSIYERAHLIAFSLTGENANWENLISGTYDLNGVMQTYEEMVVSYIKETNNHVLYRVTPLFEGDNLLATGVNIEAWSVEDSGAGICFNIFIYNVETDYIIDYKTGAAQLDPNSELMKCTFVINKSNKKFHLPTCKSVTDMSDANKIFSYKTFEELIAEGYSKCGNCLKNYGN
jgi:DNA-entry nuclease